MRAFSPAGTAALVGAAVRVQRQAGDPVGEDPDACVRVGLTRSALPVVTFSGAVGVVRVGTPGMAASTGAREGAVLDLAG